MSTSASAAVGPPPGMRIRVSSNEAPQGPSPAAIAAANAAVAEANLYPDDQAVALRTALADHEARPLDEVAVGTGSAAVLMDLIAHECVDGGAVVAFERAFVVYRLGAANAGVPYVEAATTGPATIGRSGYQRDPQALLDAITAETRVVVIDNPGNPTGSHLGADGLRAVVAGVPEHVTIVVDEAYHHFAAGHADYGTVAELGLEHPRLLVSRTFSKAYGLAGLRVGYLLGPAALVRSIDQWRSRFNVTAPGQAAAIAALQDTDHLGGVIETAVVGRTRMEQHLRDVGVPFTASLGNFVTLEVGGPSGPAVEAFAARGIGVRPLAPYGMDDQIRITVGTEDEVDEVLGAVDDILVP